MASEPDTRMKQGEEAFDWTPLIDARRMTELRDEIGIEDLSEVVTLFLDETDQVMGRLAGEGASPDLAADLHFLKGSALNLGLSALAQECQQAELRALSGEEGPLDLADFTRTYQASKLAFLYILETGVTT